VLLDLSVLCQQEMSELLNELITPVQDKIEAALETEYGLLPMLVARGIITDHHKAAVEVIQPLSLSRRFNSHFPGEPGLVGVY